ncbi:hypothetical protein ACRXFR_07960 [Enterobacter asburiae]
MGGEAGVVLYISLSLPLMTILSVATNDENDFRRDMPLALAGSRYMPQFIVASFCWKDNL